jgi:hypothetical protein
MDAGREGVRFGAGANLSPETELEFLKSLWGLGTEEEEGYRTGPPGYIGWRNSFLGIDSGAPYTFKNTGSGFLHSISFVVKTSFVHIPSIVQSKRYVFIIVVKNNFTIFYCLSEKCKSLYSVPCIMVSVVNFMNLFCSMC